MIKKILHEPLVHFLLIGGLLYLYFDHATKTTTQTKQEQITLLEYDLGKLAKQTHLKDTTLLLDYLKYQKVLLADAYSLELYKDDKKIQQILFKKMEFILRSNAKIQEPSEKELEEYYKNHIADFSELISFDLYIKTFDPRVDKKLIEKLTVIGDLKASKDLEFLQKTTLEAISKKLGKYFALQVVSVPQKSWSKPFTLKNKTYVFYITNKTVGSPYPFEDVESRVYAHYKQAQTIKAIKESYENLLKNYIIKVQQ